MPPKTDQEAALAAATVCIDCGTANTSVFMESCTNCVSCKGLCICDDCIEKRSGEDAGREWGCTIGKCPHCQGRFCYEIDGVCWCKGCQCWHHREGNGGKCATFNCYESDCEDGEGDFQDQARMNSGDRRPWGEAKLGTELWAKVRDGKLAYLVEVIEQGGVFSPICFRSRRSEQRICMEVLVRHGLSESNRKVFKSWVQRTISDYSVCASNLEEYRDTALGRVSHSGLPHITRLIISYLVHHKKTSCDQVHEYARVLAWYN